MSTSPAVIAKLVVQWRGWAKRLEDADHAPQVVEAIRRCARELEKALVT